MIHSFAKVFWQKKKRKKTSARKKKIGWNKVLLGRKIHFKSTRLFRSPKIFNYFFEIRKNFAFFRNNNNKGKFEKPFEKSLFFLPDEKVEYLGLTLSKKGWETTNYKAVSKFITRIGQLKHVLSNSSHTGELFSSSC